MIDKIAAFFRKFEASEGPVERPPEAEMQLAAIALLVEAAIMDDDFADSERTTIQDHVERTFGLDRQEAAEMIAEAERLAKDSGQLYRFTRVVNDHMQSTDRVDLIEMMWDVAYADGQLDPYEAALMRRVANLIHVSDRDSAMARRRVIDRRGGAEPGED